MYGLRFSHLREQRGGGHHGNSERGVSADQESKYRSCVHILFHQRVGYEAVFFPFITKLCQLSPQSLRRSAATDAAPKQARISSAVALAEESEFDFIVIIARKSLSALAYSMVKESESSGFTDSIALMISLWSPLQLILMTDSMVLRHGGYSLIHRTF